MEEIKKKREIDKTKKERMQYSGESKRKAEKEGKERRRSIKNKR